MGFRFQKRVKILPGISLNFSKSGVSTSLGPRGAKVTIGHGKVRETVGIPGTGISYTSTSALGSPTSTEHAVVPAEHTEVVSAEPESGWMTAARIGGQALYWLTIGLFVAAGVVVVAFLALIFSGNSKRRH